MGRETFSWPGRIFNGGGDFFIALTSLPPEDFSWGRLFNVTPVSFLVYVDDLAKLLERHGIMIKLFADDVKVYMEIVNCDDAKKMQYALDLISSHLSIGICFAVH